MPIVNNNTMRSFLNINKCTDSEIKAFGEDISRVSNANKERMLYTFNNAKRLDKVFAAQAALMKGGYPCFSEFKKTIFHVVDEKPNNNFQNHAIWVSSSKDHKYGLFIPKENNKGRFIHINDKNQFRELMKSEKIAPILTGSRDINFFDMKIDDEIDVGNNGQPNMVGARSTPQKTSQNSDVYAVVTKPKKTSAIENTINDVSGATATEKQTYVNWREMQNAPQQSVDSAEHTYAVFGKEGQILRMVKPSEMAREDEGGYAHLSGFSEARLTQGKTM